MRNTILYIIFTLFISLSCTKDCLEPMGTIVQQEIPVAAFDKIIIHSGVETVLLMGETHKLVVEAGENRLENIHVSVENQQLEIQTDALCITTADLSPVKVYISSPNIISIRNSSQYGIYSSGILTYPNLSLLTEDYNSDYINIGNFDLQIENNSISVISNGISNITLAGTTTNLHLGYYTGIGKFEGANLVAQNVTLYHRGENNLKVNPQESLVGDIISVGDVISYAHPPIVEVVEHYHGQLLFE